jgi:protein CWC15
LIQLEARKHNGVLPTISACFLRILYSKSGRERHTLTITVINFCRKPGQGGDADNQPRDLRAELLAAEAAHQAKKNGTRGGETSDVSSASKRPLQLEPKQDATEDEDPDAKRRRILEETRDIDADSDGADSDSSEEESDEEDETAELMRELEKIKRERAEEKAKEVRRTIRICNC